MDNLNLPPGFRFCPKDGELVNDYLHSKINGLSLPHDIRDDLRLYDFPVEKLITKRCKSYDGIWYFLTKRDKKRLNAKKRRSEEGSYWKMTSCEMPIELNKVKVGVKFCFAYYDKEKKKSEWLMQELVAVDDNGEKMDDTWVLCKVYRSLYAEKKKRKNDQQPVEQEEAMVNVAAPYLGPTYLVNLAPGFRFRPKDGELLYHYLHPKINHLSHPHFMIHDDVLLYDLSIKQLTDEPHKPCDDIWYFFTKRDKKRLNAKKRRSEEGSYWKMTSCEMPIVFNKVKVGVKFCFAYYSADKKKGEWLMQELVAVDDNGEKMDDTWVLCKVYRTPDAERRKRENDQQPLEQEKEAMADFGDPNLAFAMEGFEYPYFEPTMDNFLDPNPGFTMENCNYGPNMDDFVDPNLAPEDLNDFFSSATNHGSL